MRKPCTAAEVRQMQELYAQGAGYNNIATILGRSYENVKYHLDPVYRQCRQELRRLLHYKKRKHLLRYHPEKVKEPWKIKHPFADIPKRASGVPLSNDDIARILTLYELGAKVQHISEITGISDYSVRYWTNPNFREYAARKHREDYQNPEFRARALARWKEYKQRKKAEKNEARNRHVGHRAPADEEDAGGLARPDDEML